MDEQCVEQVVEAIVSARPRAAIDVMRSWGERHGFELLAEEVLVPSLSRFSDRYAQDSESPLARGYVAAKVAEQGMEMIAASGAAPSTSGGERGRVVLGNIEDDYHGLGRRIVASFLRCDGWEVIDLGDDVLAPMFVDQALAHDTGLIGVSAMMHSTAVHIRRVREEIDRRGLGERLRLAVGGAIFCLHPELVEEVGGDATCRTAMEVSALFRRLAAEVAA